MNNVDKMRGAVQSMHKACEMINIRIEQVDAAHKAVATAKTAAEAAKVELARVFKLVHGDKAKRFVIDGKFYKVVDGDGKPDFVVHEEADEPTIIIK